MLWTVTFILFVNTLLVRLRRLGFAALLLLAIVNVAQGQGLANANVDVELIAETTQAYAGQNLWVALRIDHKEQWHTYWKNPGDAGRPTEINWDLPEGVTAGEIIWPTPERLVWPIGLVDFGYTGEVFLLTEISIDESYNAETLDLVANVVLYECDDFTCIPRRGAEGLSLPFLSSPNTSNSPAADINEILDTSWVDAFALARAAVPSQDIQLDGQFIIAEGKINLVIQATEPLFENAQSIRFIPDQDDVFEYTSEQVITSQTSSMQLTQDHDEKVLNQPLTSLSGVVVIKVSDEEQYSYQLEASPENFGLAALGGALPLFANAGDGSQLSLLVVFVFAMLGGLVLNVMPCVFPVLSIKVLGMVSSSHGSAQQQRRHGLAYTAGVIVAFLVLASVLLILQAGGAVVGWGFHMQSPWFVAALAALFFVLALSMSSVIELGSGMMGMGSSLADKEGYVGSFNTGLLACVVGSPCTVPFIGPALGFALTQSTIVTLAVFVALGFGMALPYLLFSFVPALARMLPKPGKWMLTFKKILALFLYATVLWLFTVLAVQVSTSSLVMAAVICVLMGGAAWLHQGMKLKSESWFEGSNRGRTVLIASCLLTSFAVLASPAFQASGERTELVLEEGIERYSNARLSELRASNTPVFVNMTAAWCITCLVNERVALASDEVKEAMASNNMVYLKGDWTNNDPEITAVLKSFQTSGVPLYLMFSADSSQPATVLPQILTESIMLNAIEAASQR